MESGRRGAATKAKSAAQKRSDGVEQIVKDLIALNKVFEELANLVEQQEAAVQNIDQRGEEVQTNVEQANVELTGATEKASSARRKKFWCLGIASELPWATTTAKALLTTHSPHRHHNCGDSGGCGFGVAQVGKPLHLAFLSGVLTRGTTEITGLPHRHRHPPPRQPPHQASECSQLGNWLLTEVDSPSPLVPWISFTWRCSYHLSYFPTHTNSSIRCF